MKTDKLFYRIFLNQPGLIAELLPEIPPDCEFEYSAPVIKEKETRLDGLLTPIGAHPDLPLVFLEAQMQPDQRFYGRYFRGLFTYLDQYQIARTWRGLLILLNRNLELGSEIPYQIQFAHQVERFYLEDLLEQENLSPNLALLKLIVTPESQAVAEANQILNSAETETERLIKLDLVEAILVNKFTQLTIEEVQKMLNLREADVTQTRFYQEVLQIGERGGKADMVISLLNRRCGNLTQVQEQKVRSLSLPQLESLGYALLDFQKISDLENWFRDNSLDF
jgi:predicted transposase YdaD